jgi:hypothetical protein
MYLQSNGKSIEIFYLSGGLHDTGWYWWVCERGMTPTSEEHGPFKSQEEAIRNADLS